MKGWTGDARGESVRSPAQHPDSLQTDRGIQMIVVLWTGER